MSDVTSFIRARQQEEWRKNHRVLIEDYLVRHPSLDDEQTVVDLIYSEILLRQDLGEEVREEEYLRRFPRHAETLRRQLRLHRLLRGVAPTELETPAGKTPPTESPLCEEATTVPLWKPDAAPAEERLPDLPGFEVLSRVGRGAWGVVYKARQRNLNRVVALKMLRHHEDAADAQRRTLFRREAEAVARLRHPNVVQIYEFDEHDGRPYFVMEFVEGHDLARRLLDGPLPPPDAARLVETLARAVHYAHTQGVVHRDLKPANVLVAADGTPKVVDFGLAKLLDSDRSLLPSDAIIGTAPYMAPEQADGRPHDSGPAADVHALGVLLYELLTGRRPFQGKTFLETLEQVRQAEPVSPRALRPEVSRDLETVCLKCLEKEPCQRYASAEELADRLRMVVAGEPIPDRPRGWPSKAWRFLRRPRTLRVAALLLGATGITLGALVLERILAPAPIPQSNLVVPEPDLKLARNELTDTLAQGMPYTFAGPEPLPGPFQERLDPVFALATEPDGQCFSFHSLKMGLLELTDDPRCEHYRFTAEVRHLGAFGGSEVGIYFCYREPKSQDNEPRVLFMSCTFADTGKLARRDLKERPAFGASTAGLTVASPFGEGPLVAASLILPGRGEGWGSFVQIKSLCVDNQQVTPLATPGRRLAFRPALPLSPDQNAPWRKLSVEVSGEDIVYSWRTDAGEMHTIDRITVARMNQNAHMTRLLHPELKDIPLDHRPRGGLGLYVASGKASFRNIVVEPLSTKP